MNNPLPNRLASSVYRSDVGWTVLRLTLAALIAAHGWARLTDGGIVPFGEWLTGQGLPLGFALATAITALEILGTIALAVRRMVFPLTMTFALIYVVGIVMVHAQDGWFVVGKGRNGAEYSVLLVVALLCVGLQHVKSRTAA
jgi:putative oxidoreductase